MSITGFALTWVKPGKYKSMLYLFHVYKKCFLLQEMRVMNLFSGSKYLKINLLPVNSTSFGRNIEKCHQYIFVAVTEDSHNYFPNNFAASRDPSRL